jgi:tetratricopeptide (TPR) repeat protein
MPRSRAALSAPLIFVALIGCLVLIEATLGAQATPIDGAQMDTLERAVAAEPENLKLAADYRQLAIGAATYDRSIDLFEKLAKRKDSGPNVYISLALAYVDKVPPSGEIRRLYLARDAIGALTRSIERRPTMLAYYVRGLINLYFNKLIFKRVTKGIADLEKALTMSTEDIPAAARVRVYVSLGDGYWENDQRAKAREVWRAGLAKFPDNRPLQSRLVSDDVEAARAVRRALDAGTRVDTSLRELYRHQD